MSERERRHVIDAGTDPGFGLRDLDRHRDDGLVAVGNLDLEAQRSGVPYGLDSGPCCGEVAEAVTQCRVQMGGKVSGFSS